MWWIEEIKYKNNRRRELETAMRFETTTTEQPTQIDWARNDEKEEKI